MKTPISVFIALLMATTIFAQDTNNIQMPEILNSGGRKIIRVPNILGYQTLKCDFHMHTVFSDGIVWPTYRVDEAWNEGLDAIAITDHIERNPSKTDVAGDDNSSYNIALSRAQQKNIILVKGSEITRSMPPGHFNALFIEDTNELDQENWRDAFNAAKEQGAYIIWNHPGWKAQQPDTCAWWAEHTELFEQGKIHAIEVFNEKEWYPIALDWCLEKDLAPIATSDIHGITSEMYNLKDFHRPMTLVLAKERTIDALHEALLAKRTIAWYGHKLAGKKEYLEAFFKESVTIKFIKEVEKGKVYSLQNNSDVPFEVETTEGRKLTLHANRETLFTLPGTGIVEFEVKNLYVGGTKNLKISLTL